MTAVRRWVWRFLRPVLVWAGPVLVLLVAVVAGFGYWVVQTSAGTRWAVVTGVSLAGGKVRDVEGTVADGIHIDELQFDLPGLGLTLGQAHLAVSWDALTLRRLVVRDLSAGLVDIDLRSRDEEPEPADDGAPFTLPSLPVTVLLERLAVGEVVLRQEGEVSDWRVRGLLGGLDWRDDSVLVQLPAVELVGQGLSVQAEGEARLLGAGDPWPFAATLKLDAASEREDSPWCARHHLPTLPTAAPAPATRDLQAAQQAQDAGRASQDGDGPARVPSPGGAAAVFAAACSGVFDIHADGSLDRVNLTIDGQGQDMTLSVQADLRPRDAFPARDAHVALTLPDGASLLAQLLWQQADAPAQPNRVSGSLHARGLDLGGLTADALPPSRLSASASFEAEVVGVQQWQSVALGLQVLDDSRWQHRPVAGHVTGRWAPGQVGGPMDLWASVLSDLAIQLRLGDAGIHAQGGLGRPGDQLTLRADVPSLAQLWPDLPGGGRVEATLEGGIDNQRVALTGHFLPQVAPSNDVGQAPVDIDVAATGAWQAAPSDAGGMAAGRWHGRLERLQLAHAGLALQLLQPVELAVNPSAVKAEPVWQVGATAFRALLDDDVLLTVDHAGSQGGADGWQTAGAVPELTLAPERITRLRSKLDPAFAEAQAQAPKGGVRLRDQRREALARLVFGLDWNLRFEQALAGRVGLRRLSGDLQLPIDPPRPLGLQTLSVDIEATPQGADSRWVAQVRADTQQMGGMTAQVRGLLRGGEAGLRLVDTDVIQADVDLGIQDLAWASLFVGDEFELGGAVSAQVQAQGTLAGTWEANGDIQGDGLRIVRIDDGVRLLDGTLAARLAGDRLIVDRLHFPARLRVDPKEWRTAEWVNTNPDAKGGYLDLTGQWLLTESRGDMRLTLYRYPILQRADRYAMMTGELRLDAAMPRVAISGELVADAGWFDLDILGGVPSLDSDVVVLRNGVEEDVPESPVDISMQVTIDLGPRFYLTGYGVNSGLVGRLDITMAGGQIGAIGALRTRGGAIEAYGQRLQLRRGTITFQGDIASPLLDIEALRTNQAVQAGVRISGSARRPRIDLVSYPDVSELEKLTWFLLGRAPDQSGGDVALLLSVGSSLLTSGEPFYQQFGIDELTMRSGVLGSTGSILPADTVVRRLDGGGQDDQRRYISASKRLARGITISVQQALSEAGTVGRVSYRLMQGLTAELSVGTVNGLALVWRWFSRE